MQVYHAINLYAGIFNNGYLARGWPSVLETMRSVRNRLSFHTGGTDGVGRLLNGFYLNRAFGDRQINGERHPCWDQWRKLCEWVTEAMPVALYFAVNGGARDTEKEVRMRQARNDLTTRLPVTWNADESPDASVRARSQRWTTPFPDLVFGIQRMCDADMIRTVDRYAHSLLNRSVQHVEHPEVVWYGGTERIEWVGDSLSVSHDLGPLQSCSHSVGVIDGIVVRPDRVGAKYRFERAWPEARKAWVEALPRAGSMFDHRDETAVALWEAYQGSGGFDNVAVLQCDVNLWWWPNATTSFADLMNYIKDVKGNGNEMDGRCGVILDLLALTPEQLTQFIAAVVKAEFPPSEAAPVAG